MNPKRARHAADVFLAAMRREWVKMNSGGECPVKRLEDYRPEHQTALIRSITAAVRSAGPELDKAFEERERRREEELNEP